MGAGDGAKLDEYFEGVRTLERRIEMMEQLDRDPELVVGIPRPERIPTEYREHLRLMTDLMVLAFRMDATRVISFMWANEGSNRSFPSIGVPDGHHHLTHHGGDEKMIDKVRAINIFQSQQLAYLLERLKDEPDGEGTLLDSSLIVYGSAIGDGNRHNHDNLPILLAGRGGGSHRPGRHVRYPRHTPLCNLFVSLLQEMGIDTDQFGDSTGSLGRLT